MFGGAVHDGDVTATPIPDENTLGWPLARPPRARKRSSRCDHSSNSREQEPLSSIILSVGLSIAYTGRLPFHPEQPRQMPRGFEADGDRNPGEMQFDDFQCFDLLHAGRANTFIVLLR
jgi:hypothetical protein